MLRRVKYTFLHFKWQMKEQTRFANVQKAHHDSRRWIKNEKTRHMRAPVHQHNQGRNARTRPIWMAYQSFLTVSSLSRLYASVYVPNSMSFNNAQQITRNRWCLPDIRRSEGSVQIRVDVSSTFFHSFWIGYEGLRRQSVSRYLSRVLYPHIYQGNAGHLVSMRAPKNSHSFDIRRTLSINTRTHSESGTERKVSTLSPIVSSCCEYCYIMVI